MKKALITGITGQDGSYLAEFLLKKGYEVHGLYRRSSSFNTSRLTSIWQDPHEPTLSLALPYGDLTDGVSLVKMLYDLQPDEIYHLGAQSHVRVSFDIPEYTADVTRSAPCASSKPSANPARRRAFTRPRPARCSARCTRFRSAKPPRFIRAVPTPCARSSHIGSR